jgi:hypothetical protein
MKPAVLCAIAVLCACSSSSSGNDTAPGTDDTAGGAPTIEDVSVANPYAPANTMMYAVTVTVSSRGADDAHDAMVGFAPRGTDCETGSWKMGAVQRFETEDTLTWILYNFEPGSSYDYKVQLGSTVQCGELGTPALPESLAALDLAFTKGDFQTKYLLFDTDDCSSSSQMGGERYLLALEPATENIVWYLDVGARSTLGGVELTGWRYQSDRFLATVDKRYFYEWAWDGSVITAQDVAGDACDGSGDGPCIHHDAYNSDVSGKTYVITSEQSSVDAVGTLWDVCGTGSRFLDDGFQVLDADGQSEGMHFLMQDYGYDPDQDGGPNVVKEEPEDSCDASLWSNYFDPYGTIDWTHMNSIAASTSTDGGEVIDLSVKEWDQILRVDESGALLWRLSPHAEYSDLALGISSKISGPASFAGQHDVHAPTPDTLMVFDNTGDSTGSRALRLTIAGDIATIDRSWVMVDGSGTPLVCRVEGSAELVPGTDGERVLAMCNDGFTVAELADSSGTAAVPPLAVTLPEKGFCSTGGPEQRQGLRGWYRAFPVDRIGDF